jgi:hypothetical protein
MRCPNSASSVDADTILVSISLFGTMWGARAWLGRPTQANLSDVICQRAFMQNKPLLCTERLQRNAAGWLRLYQMKYRAGKYLLSCQTKGTQVGSAVDHNTRAKAPLFHIAQRDINSLESVFAPIANNAVRRLRDDRLDYLLHFDFQSSKISTISRIAKWRRSAFGLWREIKTNLAGASSLAPRQARPLIRR